jgi:hypothetical protein
MKVSLFLIFGLIAPFVPVNVGLRAVDDVKCDEQLQHFSDALSKRESWAIECA